MLSRIAFTSSISRQALPANLLCRSFSSPIVDKVASLQTANQAEIVKQNVHDAIKKFQHHKSDTGSAASQVAAATEKIQNLMRHFSQHKKDKASYRGFQVLIAKRRQMLEYLKRKDVGEFNHVVTVLGLKNQVKDK